LVYLDHGLPRVSTIRVSGWNNDATQVFKLDSLTHPLTRMVLTAPGDGSEAHPHTSLTLSKRHN